MAVTPTTELREARRLLAEAVKSASRELAHDGLVPEALSDDECEAIAPRLIPRVVNAVRWARRAEERKPDGEGPT
jgi:hypothetical protein